MFKVRQNVGYPTCTLDYAKRPDWLTSAYCSMQERVSQEELVKKDYTWSIKGSFELYIDRLTRYTREGYTVWLTIRRITKKLVETVNDDRRVFKVFRFLKASRLLKVTGTPESLSVYVLLTVSLLCLVSLFCITLNSNILI